MITRDRAAEDAEAVQRLRPVWTEEQIRALGVRCDLVTACSIRYGVGKNRAWSMFHAGELDFPAIKVGRRVVVAVAPLLELLGLEKPTEPSKADAPEPALRLVRAG